MSICMLGKPVAQFIRSDVVSAVEAYRAQEITPRMVTLLVDGDPAARVYAEQKARIAKRIGIENDILRFPEHVRTEQLCRVIAKYNHDASVHGIMLELPLPQHVDTNLVIGTIQPQKDVDGLTRMTTFQSLPGALAPYPATPVACIRILKHYGFSLAGKDVALIGCGKTVGMPLFHLLIEANATVTVCHAGTKDLAKHLKQAEIAFVAVGKPGLIRRDMVHPDLVIVDAGINETIDGNIVGDVHPQVAHEVLAMTPTPGGVGSVTTMQLFDNLMTVIGKGTGVTPRIVTSTR